MHMFWNKIFYVILASSQQRFKAAQMRFCRSFLIWIPIFNTLVPGQQVGFVILVQDTPLTCYKDKF